MPDRKTWSQVLVRLVYFSAKSTGLGWDKNSGDGWKLEAFTGLVQRKGNKTLTFQRQMLRLSLI